MSTELRDALLRQFDVAWALLQYHLETLSTEECLWRPASQGLHVWTSPAGGPFQADWPEHEGYELGPSSIGWMTWHLCFWWSMVVDHSFGAATLQREAVRWPGSAEAVRARVAELEQRWRSELGKLTDDDLRDTARTRWPFTERPFMDVVAWANVELTKSAAELGYARFLYAVRAG